MVREDNVLQATAERALKESQMQIEVLTAEVAALKTLVLTSTPSRPNPHLHPQIDPRGNRPKDDSTLSGTASLFFHFQILKCCKTGKSTFAVH
jgi:Rab-3A-interacting protein